MYGYIYITENLINRKKYIGKHKSEFFEPNKYIGSGKILENAIRKYGKENFKCSLLEECNSKEELNEREKYWISYYRAMENSNFYNISPGGEGDSCFNYLPEVELKKVREKIRLSKINMKEETKVRMSQSHKGKILSEEHKKNISLGSKGKPKPSSGEKRRGVPKPTVSEKLKGTHYIKKYKNIYCLELNELFNGIYEVLNKYPKYKKSTLEAVLRGKQNTAYSYHWCYGVKNKQEGIYKIQNNLRQSYSHPNSKKVQNLNTGEIFNSYTQAELKYANKVTSGISSCINKPYRWKGYYWVSLKEDNIPYTKEERENILLEYINKN